MKRSLILTRQWTCLILITSLSSLSLGDCPKDLDTCRVECQRVIAAGKAALKAKDDQITSQNNAIDDLNKSLGQLQADVDSQDRALAAWYHNPFVLTGLGLLTGSLVTLYFNKK